jgi:hypothetical protein
MFIFFLSVLGSVVFIGLVLCARRFDSTGGTDGRERGGGEGGRGPGPDFPSGPLDVVDPPLGEIRAIRARERIRS